MAALRLQPNWAFNDRDSAMVELETESMRRFRLCQHVKDNGELCGSPAMRRKSCCYYHDELRRRERRRSGALLVQSARAEHAANLRRIRTLVLNMFGGKILEGTSCVTFREGRSCEDEGEGRVAVD